MAKFTDKQGHEWEIHEELSNDEVYRMGQDFINGKGISAGDTNRLLLEAARAKMENEAWRTMAVEMDQAYREAFEEMKGASMFKWRNILDEIGEYAHNATQVVVDAINRGLGPQQPKPKTSKTAPLGEAPPQPELNSMPRAGDPFKGTPHRIDPGTPIPMRPGLMYFEYTGTFDEQEYTEWVRKMADSLSHKAMTAVLAGQQLDLSDLVINMGEMSPGRYPDRQQEAYEIVMRALSIMKNRMKIIFPGVDGRWMMGIGGTTDDWRQVQQWQDITDAIPDQEPERPQQQGPDERSVRQRLRDAMGGFR